MKPNFCLLPKRAPIGDSQIYRKLLAIHCDAPDKESPDHQCTGCISISAASVVFRCKRCGDAKLHVQACNKETTVDG